MPAAELPASGSIEPFSITCNQRSPCCSMVSEISPLEMIESAAPSAADDSAPADCLRRLRLPPSSDSSARHGRALCGMHMTKKGTAETSVVCDGVSLLHGSSVQLHQACLRTHYAVCNMHMLSTVTTLLHQDGRQDPGVTHDKLGSIPAHSNTLGMLKL